MPHVRGAFPKWDEANTYIHTYINTHTSIPSANELRICHSSISSRPRINRIMTSLQHILKIICCSIVLACIFLANVPPDKSNDKQSSTNNSRNLETPFADQFPDRSISHDLVKLCYAMGTTSNTIPDDNVLPPNFTTHYYVDKTSTDTQAMIATSDVNNYIAIVFRNTEPDNLDDWKTNLNFSLERSQIPGSSSSVKLHNGYQGALIGNGLASELDNKVRDLLGDSSLNLNGQVYITGNSMGGTYSLMLGVWLIHSLLSVR